MKHWWFLCLAVFLTSCAPRQQDNNVLVTLVADGRERSLTLPLSFTVDDVLRREGIELGTLDRVNPPRFSQVSDGLRVTVVRVQEQTECQQEDVPYRQRTVLNEGLAPGEQRLGQAGRNGVQQVCYRITINDGVRQAPVETSRTEITAPQDEVIYVGPTGQLDPVQINGTLAYVSNGNIWLMRGSSTTKRPITNTGDVDERVFALSPDGRAALYARYAAETDRAAFFNRLHLLPDTTRDSQPVALVPINVLSAQWVPGRDNTISYSTGEPRPAAPGWEAYNDLWTMRIDPSSGDALSVREIVPRSQGGLYGWWGTNYVWSPDGSALAWVRADSLGLVNLNTGALQPLLSYPVFNTRQSWSWRATVSWTPDSRLILTTVHGQPIGSEPAETSPAFHVAVADAGGAFSAEIVRNSGIWSMPTYSPVIGAGEQTRGYIAYLVARDIADSINDAAPYDLYLADRDGSNARKVFPTNGGPGLHANAGLVWSPYGGQLAFIYQGNLWVIDVESGIANQLTLDGAASKPVWAR